MPTGHRTLDEEIAARLRESDASGELKAAAGYGRPLDFGDGYAETPEAVRMPFKMLKDAGFTPPEVALRRELHAARTTLATLDAASDAHRKLLLRINAMELKLSFGMERLLR